MFGIIGYSGWILKGSGSAPPSGGGYKQEVGIAGAGGVNPTVGLNTWEVPGAIGATNLNFTIVNNLPEMIDNDFTFDPATAILTRPNNVWQPEDKIIVPFTPAS